MNNEEKFQLLKQNTEEIITEDALKELIKKKKSPVVYCGYEPSGPLHLGHFVTITKLMDFAKVGFKVKILLADIHAMLNKKSSEEFISKEVKAWEKTIKAIGLKCEIVLGSSFQYKKEYQFDLMRLAQATTINRGIRSMQEIARDVDNATISQLLYPIMQVADIKYLDVDVALGGLEQRKVHMIGKDLAKELGHNFIPFHTSLITSLKGPGEKMSKSIPGSGVSVTDSYDEIKKTIKAAYCPEKIVQDNPILQISKLLIFPQLSKLEISRPEKYGGNLLYKNYESLEADFTQGKLHPLDLKTAVADALEKIISPIRNNFK
jgi:tyrosyl-tRNA synthetase